MIELSNYYAAYKNKLSGVLIKYNKKTKEITLNGTQYLNAQYVFNDKNEIISAQYKDDTINENLTSLLPALKIITSGALVLEDFFRYGQDIEGGIKLNGNFADVFFWQTRNIIAKTVKKI